MRNKKRTTLLRYWTARYLMTLIVGLMILGAGSVWWIRQTVLENRIHLMEYLAVETADRAAEAGGNFEHVERRLGDREQVLQMDKPPRIFITDMEGTAINTGPSRQDPDRENKQDHFPLNLPAEVIEEKDAVQKFRYEEEEVYIVKSPIELGGSQTGWVVVMQNASDLTNVDQEYRLLFTLLAGLGFLGWGVIYFLTKRILKPIQDVSKAAAQVRDGDYNILLDTDARELEIYDLVSSFKEMTNRLIQLEQLRAELLAGVTHDLKTPVTSISGLVQAVRDGIVTGDERQEFLDITLKEVHRLQTMIADLLDFNSLAAGGFSIRTETSNMNKLVKDVVRQWQVTQHDHASVRVNLPDEPVYTDTDPLRLQQIMINLLNNSYQALDKEGSITVSLSEGRIDVIDTGSGIPEEEIDYVFERFFRGEKKKLKVRGLGLGLPFSKMLAKALGADLILKETSDQGTTFSIVWSK
ncbi:HAMP domain-containing sensor histidine kinase [Bacillus sp. V2I10]|uniref:sensor histidine kinase n=1 Tax=Bacillus sp. V2I10 TaxID=3042276 RepID=UPI0027D77364|nr:HAMP domain-containing sensor histidine kinase [Bacillus sp. V2I10]